MMSIPSPIRRWTSTTFTLLAIASVANAQLVSFDHPDGTSHWYEVVHTPAGITWADAHANAAAKGGYLANATSTDENDEIAAAVSDPKFWYSSNGHMLGPWLGGYQKPGSAEPAGGWSWAEGDAFSFDSWETGFPKDTGNADRIHFGSTGIGKNWIDSHSSEKMLGYVVEYSGPTVLRTLGILQDDDGSAGGYTLISPWQTKNSFLFDSRGRVINSWVSDYIPGMSSYMLPGGHMIRCGNTGNSVFGTTGGSGGIVQEFDWDGNLVWEFKYSDSTKCQHHDVAVMPNGNVLMVVWEYRSAQQAIDNGRDPARLTEGALWPDMVVEIKPDPQNGGASVVWQWNPWDHLIQDRDASKKNFGKVSDHPELVDINFPYNGDNDDWMHVNSVDYNADLDQVMISVRSFDELWVIDHSTTTQEAAGHTGGRYGKGGDLLYRWGNPEAYKMGTAVDRTLFKQHDAQWIKKGLPGAGNILLFNNGGGRPGGEYSSVDEVVPPTTFFGSYVRQVGKPFGPVAAKSVFEHADPKSFYSGFVGGAQRLPNGNTVLAGGWLGWTIEVDPSGKHRWEYRSPANASSTFRSQGTPTSQRSVVHFRSPRYFAKGPELGGLTAQQLEPGDPLEEHDTVLLVEGSTVRYRTKPGFEIDFDVRAGGQPNKTYLMATSVTPGLLPLDFRFLRIGVDPVLMASLNGGAPTVFKNYMGSLDSNGRAEASMALPTDSRLVGFDFYTVFVVADPSAPSGFSVLSNTVKIEVE